ncbi:FoF1 ATP synthase subunit delta/epsilon [Planctomicrobium piriforme]|uniref:ATP synthase epsilon chain n=1 Tax=Planctomicrobium piriforme TaxID=1576369 RepID=A0A1I3S6I9_9PLAN|nr:F0F1 ATP synthase subunit epsilon [Planctomicrobium piriforme]SFJ53219.1 F-type H+-transporting ATPase subunit epsilon [Planctomicrobium piriforme]
MIAATELRLVLVTPEKTLFDQPVKALRFPLFDGQIGVLPGRAPLIGRLGIGELKFDLPGGGSERFFIDGGFAQIKGSIVTLLTSRAMPISAIDVEKAKVDLAAALASVPHDEAGFTQKAQAVDRARKMIELRTKRV